MMSKEPYIHVRCSLTAQKRQISHLNVKNRKFKVNYLYQLFIILYSKLFKFAAGSGSDRIHVMRLFNQDTERKLFPVKLQKK